MDCSGVGGVSSNSQRCPDPTPNVIRDRAHLERMLALLDAGAVRPPTIVRYKLADAAQAHRVSEARHLQGKLVLEVR